MYFGKNGRFAPAARKGPLKIAHAVCACLAAMGGAASADTDSTWNGGIGNWSDPAQWDIAVVPQTGTNNAIIATGQVTLDASFTIGALTLTGGQINGANNLTVNGPLNWSAGALVDAGTTHALGAMTLDTTGDKILGGRTLISDGVATWNGGNFVTSAGAVVTNNGTFIASFDGNLQSQGGTTFFNNLGTFQKTAGAGGASATTIAPVFNNSGAVQIQTGRLAIAGGGSATGTFAISAGADLVFQSDYTLAAASGLSGAGNASVELGTITVAGTYALTGTTSVNGGTIAFNSAASTKDLSLTGGLLTGTATLTASGAVTWTGSVLQGTGALLVNGTLDLSGSDHGLSARTFTNAGAGTWSAGNILFLSGATLNNSGTLENTFAATMQTSGANPGTFNNSGLFNKSGTGATSINPMLFNSGTMRVSEGTLALAGGGSATGRFEALTSTRLRTLFDYTYGPTSTITGAGTVEFAGGTNTVAGTYDVSGRTEINGGVTSFTGNVVNLGTTLALNGGFIAINTPLVNASKLDQFGGGIDGTGNIVLHDLMTWDSGAQKGSGTTTASAGLLIQGTTIKTIDTRTVINSVGSSATWSAGDLSGFGTGTLQNNGTFTTTFDGNFSIGNGTPAFTNTGLFIKSGGAGLTSFGAAFNNSGTARVDAGSLFVTSGTATGNFNLLAGGIQFAGAYNLASGASITGTNKALLTGILNVTGPATAKYIEQSPSSEMTGPGNLTVEKYSWLGGRLTGSGTTTVTSTITLAGTGKEIDGRTLRINPGATASWTTGDINVFTGSTLDNAGTFDNSFDGSFFQDGVVNNSGLFVKSAGNGVTASVASFNNSGTARVLSGLLYLGAGLNTGNFDLVGGPIELAGGYMLGTGSTSTGTNVIDIFGQVNVTGNASAKFVSQSSSGEMTGVGNLSIEHFTWTGGQLTGSGTTTIVTDALLSGGGKEIVGRTLKILPGASALWSSGDIGGFPGALIDNAGTFQTNFDGSLLYASTQSAAFKNSGLFLKSAGTSRTVFTTLFNNSGTARVAAGILTLSGGGSSTGNFDLTGGTLELTNGYQLGTTTTITGTNNAFIIGNVSITGAVVAKNVTQSAGVLTGAGLFIINNFTWQGGTEDGGGGMTHVQSVLSLSTTAQKTIDARTIQLLPAAVATWSAGDLRVANAGSINNQGTFNATSDNSIFPGDGATGLFSNSGLFFKNGTAGSTSVVIPFNNTGIVRVGSGVISLAAGGNSSGQFDLLGGNIELSGGYVLAAGATITGSNTAKIIGDINVTGAVAAKNVQQTAGNSSGTGTFTIDNFSWKGGTLSGAGATIVTTALDLSGTQYTLDTRTLRNSAAATATWSAGNITAANGGKIDNLGLFLNTFDGSAIYQTGASPSFENKGEFRKSAGTGVTNFGILFNNTGVAKAQTGTLRLAGGGSASGNFDASAGAVVELGFDYTLAAGATFTGAGITRLTGGVTTLTGPVSAVNFEQTSGTLNGGGNFTAAQYAWKGGTLAGGGTTTITGSMTINGSDLNLNARTLAIAPGASAVWSAGDIRIALGGTINNAGTFDIADDVNAVKIDGIDSVFNNTGTLRKNGGTNFASFAGVLLNNTGTLEVSAGTLIAGVAQFDSANAALTGGTWKVFGGAKLDLGGGPGIATNFANVTLDGATANFTKINDLADNRGTFTIKNGKQFLTGGTFDNSGTISSDATSGILFGNVFTNSGTFTNAGTTYANFAFNSGAFTQTGPLTVNIQMINNGTGVTDIGGVQKWASGAHLVVNGGTVILRTDAGSSAKNLVIDAKGGTTQLKVTQHLQGLNIDGGKVNLDAGGNKIIRTTGYAPGAGIDNWNGQLDIADNRLIVDYAVGSPIDVIANQLKMGYNAAGPHWTGNGLISSTAALDPTVGVGYIEASQAPLLAANFGGESIAGNAVLVRNSKFGDTNMDGRVTFGDFQRLEAGFGKPGHWFTGDFNYDGIVDRTDLMMLLHNYGQSFGVPAAPVPAEELAAINAFAGNVPEPTGLLLLGFAGILLSRRRKNNAKPA